MKVKENFVLREIADEFMVIPVGECTDQTHGIISLTETGAFLWKLLKSDQSIEKLVMQLVNEYQVTREIADADVKKFIEKLKEYNCLEE